jgi:hypothetical protein
MLVLLARAHERIELAQIEPDVAVRVELEIKTRAVEQRRRAGGIIAQPLAQPGLGDAQVIARLGVRQLRPEQPKQRLAALGGRRLDRKVGQQRQRFAVGQRDLAQLRMGKLRWTEQCETHVVHWRISLSS